MDLKDFKKSRLILYVENNSREKLEDVYSLCFGEFPIDGLTTEDLQYNIVNYLLTSDNIDYIYRYLFK